MFPLRDTQPSYSRPLVTVLIIILNVVVFLHEFSLDEYSRNYFIAQYGLIPARFSLSHFWPVISSMFLHGGWMHIIGNMWFLWIFGDNVEDALGHFKYLVFYLLCGIAAGMTQVLFSAGSRLPMVGASGAIAGVMGAYLIKFPKSRIVTLVFIFIFFTTIEVPAGLMLAYWFFIQFFSGVGTIGYSHVSQGGTAFFAHIGGFITGMILVGVMGTRQVYMRRRDASW
ncbi:MAG TPA: rhomboid family intramembrane serine protease [Bryobacteraceae bacterium]|jgi:membrane associated rhomboid family serine protease|nr:rhomboid family intramembrane serine protease [Bryobacteraceae bacterium]